MDFKRLCEVSYTVDLPVDSDRVYDGISPALYYYMLQYRWHGMNGVDARSADNMALKWAIKNGDLDVCNWMYNTFGLNGDDARSGPNYLL